MSEDKPVVKIIDLTDAIAKGVAVKVGPDMFIGPVTSRTDPPPQPQWLRQPEIYTAEPPQGTDGKIPMQFQITEKCGIKEKGKPACRLNLIVARIKETRFETDEHQGGGQLVYDERAITQWRYCPKHGPFPAGSYEKVDGKWVPKKVEKVVV